MKITLTLTIEQAGKKATEVVYKIPEKEVDIDNPFKIEHQQLTRQSLSRWLSYRLATDEPYEEEFVSHRH